MDNRFLALLREKPFLLADGATGTNLFTRGLISGEAPEFWNVERPDDIAALHRSFVDAGSDLILTNSFGGNAYRLKLHNAEHRVSELNRAAAEIARRVADEADRPVVVAGSIGPTGELFEPLGPLTIEEAADAFAEQAQGLADGGADVLWIETMSAPEEIEAALSGAGRTGLPIVSTMSFDTAGRTMMGLTPAGFAEFCSHVHEKAGVGPCAIGANCGVGPAELLDSVIAMHAQDPNAIIIAKGNCGIPEYVEGMLKYTGTVDVMVRYAQLARDGGARIIGGCCGTTPEHIRAMRAALDAYEPSEDLTLQRIEDAIAKPWANVAANRAAESANAERADRRRRRK